MVLQTNGPISMSQIASEYNIPLTNISFTSPSINPNKGTIISMRDWYGKGKSTVYNYGPESIIRLNPLGGINVQCATFSYTTVYTFTLDTTIGALRIQTNKTVDDALNGDCIPFAYNNTTGDAYEIYSAGGPFTTDRTLYITDVGRLDYSWSLSFYGLTKPGSTSVTEKFTYSISTQTYSTSINISYPT